MLSKNDHSKVSNSPSEYRQSYNRKQVLEGFDRVTAKVKARKVPAWDKMQHKDAPHG